ncbi:MAG: hypothetical protein OJI67_24455, partial [Prosthecobacter sp.]|nr:hypothetical protein [Prosthecobacter sp.]
VYLIRSQAATDQVYTGFTEDLRQRLRERYANEALSLLNDDAKQNKPLRRKAAVRPGPPMSLNVRSRMRGGKR